MNLKDAAKKAGIKQCDIAQKLGVSEPAVSLWFSRQATIPTRCIAPLAGLLSMPVGDVLAVAEALPKPKGEAA